MPKLDIFWGCYLRGRATMLKVLTLSRHDQHPIDLNLDAFVHQATPPQRYFYLVELFQSRYRRNGKNDRLTAIRGAAASSELLSQTLATARIKLPGIHKVEFQREGLLNIRPRQHHL